MFHVEINKTNADLLRGFKERGGSGTPTSLNNDWPLITD